MSHEQLSTDCAHHYPHSVALAALQPRLLALVEQSATAAFTAPQMTKALADGLEDAATLMRAVPIQEGNLLEKGIALLAGLNPDLVALTDNIRLPVTAAALQLIDLNDETLYRRLALDADAGGRKAYTPDMLLVQGTKRLAYVVDVKRSLGSYESTRIADLKSRMLASSLMVPDLLYKEHRRLAVDEVRAVIVNADGQKVDVDNGVWPLGHLDHLLEMNGAGLAIEWLRARFAAAIERNWKVAVRRLAELDRDRAANTRSTAVAALQSGKPSSGDDEGDGTASASIDTLEATASGNASSTGQRTTRTAAPPLRVSLARAPDVAAGF